MHTTAGRAVRAGRRGRQVGARVRSHASAAVHAPSSSALKRVDQAPTTPDAQHASLQRPDVLLHSSNPLGRNATRHRKLSLSQRPRPAPAPRRRARRGRHADVRDVRDSDSGHRPGGPSRRHHNIPGAHRSPGSCSWRPRGAGAMTDASQQRRAGRIVPHDDLPLGRAWQPLRAPRLCGGRGRAATSYGSWSWSPTSARTWRWSTPGPGNCRYADAAGPLDRRVEGGPDDPRAPPGQRHSGPVGVRRGRGRPGAAGWRAQGRPPPPEPNHGRGPVRRFAHTSAASWAGSACTRTPMITAACRRCRVHGVAPGPVRGCPQGRRAVSPRQ